MIDPGIGNLLNDAAETIGDGDDFFDGVAHFFKKNKSEEEKEKIDEKSNDFKAAGKIARGTLKGAALLLTVGLLVKLVKK